MLINRFVGAAELWQVLVNAGGKAPSLTDNPHGGAMYGATTVAPGSVLRAELAWEQAEREFLNSRARAPKPGLRPEHHIWTLLEIRERLSEAADTLYRLPGRRPGERSLRAVWPDTIREWLAYASTETPVRLAAPSPEAIDRLDEVLEWCHLWLTRDQRTVLWARAQEPPMTWRRLEVLDAQTRRGKGRQEKQLRNIRDDAEARILNRLNGTPQRMRLSRPGGV